MVRSTPSRAEQPRSRQVWSAPTISVFRRIAYGVSSRRAASSRTPSSRYQRVREAPGRSRETPGPVASSAGCCRPIKNKDTFSSRVALWSVVFGRLGRRRLCVPRHRVRQARLRGLVFPPRRQRNRNNNVWYVHPAPQLPRH